MSDSESEYGKDYAKLSQEQRNIIDSLTKDQRYEYIQFTPYERQLYDTLMKEGRSIRETIQLIRGDETTIFTANTGLEFMSPESGRPNEEENGQLREKTDRLTRELANKDRELANKDRGLKAQGLVIKELSRQNVQQGEQGERIKELEAQLARLQYQ